MRARLLLGPGLLLATGGCSGWQNALDTASGDAEHIAWLFWLFTGLLGAIWAAVMVAMALSLRRGRPRPDPLARDPVQEHGASWLVGSLTGATLVTVLILTGLSYAGQRRLYGWQDETVKINVTGHQWWWEVTYEDAQQNRVFTTANEIHIPVGRRVVVGLASADVIHSFWVPSLTGKMDAIPKRDNQISFVAERPGTYRGQCAEFCGLQHAHMGLLVVAEAPEEFERWRAAQLGPAASPGDEQARQGETGFRTSSCVLCHSVRGTMAGGRAGPDLTHVGSRRFIGAGTLPMSRGNLAGWIANPHGVKPGVLMPASGLEPNALLAIAAYLEGLK
jgi:cytochrome c oxidase subunit 2